METRDLYQLYLRHPSVETDTRKLRSGDIFFALKGPSFDGNTFASQALDLGAAYAVIDNPSCKTDHRCILVDDVLTALQNLARYHRQQLNIPFIAITGSNGKTTTKELITSTLRRQFRTSATDGNLNNHIGVPLTLLKVKPNTEIAVIEMGANHRGEIASYCHIALPTHGLITNCGKAHMEGFGGEEGVRKGKGELYDYLKDTGGTIFRNADLDYLEDMARGVSGQITYGSANAHFIGRPLMDSMFLNVAILNAGAETTIHTRLVGGYNFPNVMAAVAIGLHFGIPIDKIREAIEDYQPDNSRSQFLSVGSNQVILDAYNANPTSMKAAIANFAALPGSRKILWLGAMKEMGEYEASEHEALVSYIRGYDWDDVILAGKEFEGLAEDYLWFATSAEAATFVQNHPPANAAILIKGSRGSRMERLLDALKEVTV